MLSSLQTLAEKLTHPVHDFRLRTATNIIFKVKNDLISDELQDFSSSICCISNKIKESLDLVLADQKNNSETVISREPEAFLPVLLDLISVFYRKYGALLSMEVLSHILESLTTLSVQPYCETALKGKISRSIEDVCAVKTSSNTYSKNDLSSKKSLSPSREYDSSTASTHSHTHTLSLRAEDIPGESPYDAYDVGNSTRRGAGADGGGGGGRMGVQSWSLRHHSAHAGSILFSSLSSSGWKFPSFLLTDSDERYVFDIEVGGSV
jgi:hypothetical protein